MTDYLPEAVLKGLEEARLAMLRRSSRLCVHDGDDVFRVLRLWESGFALAARDAPRLRGHVDLYDGARHLYRCLVVDSEEQGEERLYEFKWSTMVSDQPPADFARGEEPPAGYLPKFF